MNLWLRLFKLWCWWPWAPKLDLRGVSRLNFRVCPTDLDVYGHMNNSRFLALMDLGRIDLLTRAGTIPQLKSRGWNPLVASTMIRYQKPLLCFQTFELTTRILAWDDRWFFIEQVFIRGEKIIAKALVKGLFYGPQGSVPIVECLTHLGVENSSPCSPEFVRNWQKSEHEFADYEQ